MKKKLLAAALAVTMMLPMFASCSKNSGSSAGLTVDESAWFDLNEATIQTDMSLTTYDYILSKVIGTFDDTIVLRKYGSLKTPSGADYNNMDYSELMVEQLEFFDMNGSLINTVSIEDYLREHNLAEDSYVSRIIKNDNKIDITITQYNLDTGNDINYLLSVDPSTYELSDLTEIEASDVEGLMEGKDNGHMDTVQVGSYTCEKYWIYTESQNFTVDLFLIDENNNITEFDFSEKFPDTEIYDITAFIDIGSGRYLLTAYN